MQTLKVCIFFYFRKNLFSKMPLKIDKKDNNKAKKEIFTFE